MKYNKLGRTGLDCSLLGFGTWQIGGGRWKGLNDIESIKLLQNSLDHGINIYDSAIVYGQYRGSVNELHSHSIELLGKAFSGSRRERAIICIKIGQLDEYSHKAVLTPEKLVEQLKGALRQLGTDYIDICLIHAPTISQIEDQRALSVLQTLQLLGFVRYIGYSFEAEPIHAQLALNQGVDVLMIQYNLIDNDCVEVFEAAEKIGVGVLVGGPYKRGYLTGRFKNIEDLPIADNYWNWNLTYCRRKVESILKEVNEIRGSGVDDLALRKKAIAHIAYQKSVNSIIVGHREFKEVLENTEILDQIMGL